MTNQDLEPALNSLIAYVEADIQTQRRTIELLEAQRAAITERRGAGLEELTEAMVGELRDTPARVAQRDDLLHTFARAWGLPIAEVTLSLIVERMGPPAARLATLRSQLRGAAAEVVRANRRLSALVGMQRRLVHDVLRMLLSEQDPTAADPAEGVLLNAKA